MTTNIFSRKNGLRYAALASVAALGVIGSANAYAAGDSNNANANVIAPITITAGAALEFGTFSVGATGGTVVVDTADSRSVTGDVLKSETTPGASATFTLGGNVGSSYAITLPSSPVTITGGTGSDTMTVDNFVSNPSGTGTLATASADVISVGATLTVSANQPGGTYTGPFTVTVDYN